jgi:hypothetical protein
VGGGQRGGGRGQPAERLGRGAPLARGRACGAASRNCRLVWSGQGRAGQGRPGQGRAGGRRFRLPGRQSRPRPPVALLRGARVALACCPQWHHSRPGRARACAQSHGGRKRGSTGWRHVRAVRLPRRAAPRRTAWPTVRLQTGTEQIYARGVTAASARIEGVVGLQGRVHTTMLGAYRLVGIARSGWGTQTALLQARPNWCGPTARRQRRSFWAPATMLRGFRRVGRVHSDSEDRRRQMTRRSWFAQRPPTVRHPLQRRRPFSPLAHCCPPGSLSASSFHLNAGRLAGARLAG